MKESPEDQKLEDTLRSSKIVAGGFMGHDERTVYDIIGADSWTLSKCGYNHEQVAARMKEITDRAISGLGIWVEINEQLMARVEEAKGSQPCPWPHPGRFAKRVTVVKNIETGKTVQWSDLNIHLIGQHGFFEGRGSHFRNEPESLVKIIF
jgi:hypothetical protein